ncbi:hypothetical protein BcepF1.026 [Burkholderia phage BcepF1]|uniref:Uncharacterized protein n=1 Tax=Burkholderia phage BcepF1 TaxID=2886897 RepID=A1YZT0_9CAUD|nr:hypothetical protein BcepF1.026 [Burkholderia phage BcepF1]ABL96757.1 hypothetical protein BcepF1.026 [Burkholderia phage BcepF1]
MTASRRCGGRMIRRSVTAQCGAEIDRFRMRYVTADSASRRRIALTCQLIWHIGLDRELDDDDGEARQEAHVRRLSPVE